MDEVKVGNKMVKARQYPWGTVQGNSHQNGLLAMYTERKVR